MRSPLVSFVLPTWNRAEYLAECIDSVIGQTYTNWELVVVSDGSTDSTDTLMKYYCNKDKRIIYYPKAHAGIAATRNTGVNLSKGEYIAVLDSDDLCGPERLKRQLKVLQKGYDICYSSYLRADENATVIDGVQPPKPSEITKDTLLKDQGIPHVTITAKRECFLDHPYLDKHRVNDDLRLVVEWIKAGYRMEMISDPLMIVRFHTRNTSRISWEEVKEINEEVRKEIRESF